MQAILSNLDIDNFELGNGFAMPQASICKFGYEKVEQKRCYRIFALKRLRAMT